jgi:hypothetical protein
VYATRSTETERQSFTTQVAPRATGLAQPDLLLQFERELGVALGAVGALGELLLLNGAGLSGEQGEWLERLLSSGQKARELLDSFLLLARNERTAATYTCEPKRVSSVVGHAVRGSAWEAESLGASASLGELSDAEVFVDVRVLNKTVRGLLNVFYTAAGVGGEVVVSAVHAGDVVNISLEARPSNGKPVSLSFSQLLVRSWERILVGHGGELVLDAESGTCRIVLPVHERLQAG